jgi:hypothetical protein
MSEVGILSEKSDMTFLMKNAERIKKVYNAVA